MAEDHAQPTEDELHELLNTLGAHDTAASEADTDPTDGQKEAGNYRKGHTSFQGIPISIENPKGSTRRGVGADGEPWETKMPSHYGYVKRSTGADGDNVDVYIGPNAKSDHVYLIDQRDPDKGTFDEHKAMLGYDHPYHARDDYHAAFSDGRGPDRVGAVSRMSVADFKNWVRKGDTKKPFAAKGYAEGGAVEPDDDGGIVWDDEPPAGNKPASTAQPAANEDGVVWDDAPPVSASRAAYLGARRGVAPTLGGILTGAAVGAAVGGPAAPITSLVGGIVGAMGGGYAIDKMQESMWPASDEEKAAAEQHPYWTMAGGLAPAAVAFSPGRAGALASRVLSGGIMGGVEAGQELATEGSIDPGKVALATGAGAVFNTPTRIGRAAMGAGERAGEAVRNAGRPDLKATPESQTIKDDAATAELSPTTGVAEEKAAPNVDVSTIGNPDSAGVRSERSYSKTEININGDKNVIIGDLAPDQMAALRESMGTRELPEPSAPEQQPVPRNESTGIAEAAASRNKPIDLVAPDEAPQRPSNGPTIPTEEERAIEAARIQREGEDRVRQKVALQQKGEAFEPSPPLTPEQQAFADRTPDHSQARAAQPAPKIVTAAVTDEPAPAKPGKDVIKKAIKAAKEAGMHGIAKRLEKAEPEHAEQVLRALRPAGERSKVAGMDTPVVAASEVDARNKARSIAAAKSAFDAFPPQAAPEIPTSKADIGLFRDRLQGAIDHATEQNLGKDPLAYKPREEPAAGMWLRAAKRFVAGRPTPKRVAEFVALEKQLRSGNPEDVANVRSTNRIEGDLAMSKRPTFDLAEQTAAREFPSHDLVSHEEAEAWTKPQPVDLARLMDENGKVSENLIRSSDTPKSKAKQLEDEAEAEKTGKLKRAREAAALMERGSPKEAIGQSEGAASGVRKVEVSPDLKAKYEAKIAEAVNKANKRDTPILDLQMADKPPDERTLPNFFKDESGALNIKRVANSYKVRESIVRKGLEKYLGIPISDMGRKVANEVRWIVASKNKLHAEIIHLLDARWYQWKKGATPSEVFTYLKTMEAGSALQQPKSGTGPAAFNKATFKKELIARGLKPEQADWMADEAPLHRALLDRLFKEDELHGSTADYRDSYIPHLFKDGKKAEAFIAAQIQHLGPTWYQKVRTFDLLEQAVKAGHELKFDNPIDLISARWAASAGANTLVEGLRRMEGSGTAFPAARAPAYVKKNWTEKYITPDHQQWYIHPDGVNIWRNALVAKSISERTDVWGSIYRTWMAVKNIWMPIELSLSAFHELHIVGNISPAQNITRALKLSAADPGSAGKNALDAVKWSVTDPLFSLPLDRIGMGLGKAIDDAAGNRFSQFRGREAMNFWQVPHNEQTPMQQLWTSLFKEAGMVPYQAKQDVIGFQRKLASAVADKSAMAIPYGLGRAVEVAQSAMFKWQIPALKNVTFMRNVEAAFKMDPDLITNAEKRKAVLGELAKNVDDRFGEMHYDNLHWNRYLKDSAIGSMLSLSWNLGQLRQAGGAAANLLNKSGGRGTLKQKEIYKATDKGTFVTTYVALSMGTAGLLSWALSGTAPTGLDYFFPRNGEKNPDGSPQRLTTPFNTREAPMLIGHKEAHDSWIGGAAELLWNKMILSPLVEAWNNRDFYGNRLYDTNAPWYKQALQLIDSTLGNHVNPIAISGASRAKQQGGGTKGQVLSYAGFGPAPKYASGSALENRIDHLFREETNPNVRPYEYGEKTGLGKGFVQSTIRGMVGDKTRSEGWLAARAKVSQAKMAGDAAAEAAGRHEMIVEGGASARTAMAASHPEREYPHKFSRLPLATQQILAKRMSTEEYKRFIVSNPEIRGKARAALIRKQSANP